mmetsp:Transcript_12408/g.30489  ORF Transcript_12408/g.30489 Transcript_12408/m.30489 type:complete len:465 (-) Transcript_12408:6-1400(-)
MLLKAPMGVRGFSSAARPQAISRRVVLVRAETQVEAPPQAAAPASDADTPASLAYRSQPRRSTPRPGEPRPGTPRPGTPRARTPRPGGGPAKDFPVPANLVRDDTITLQFSDTRDIEAIAKRIQEHPLLSATEPQDSTAAVAETTSPTSSPDAPSAGSTKQLRVVALTGRVVSATLEAIALANSNLRDAGYQLQVSASLRRPPALNYEEALKKDALGGFFFVYKVRTDSIPAPPELNLRVKADTPYFRYASLITDALVGEQRGTALSSVGFSATLQAFKAMMQARVRLITGWYKTEVPGVEEAGAPPPGYGPNKRVDFAFVPKRLTETIASTTGDATATTLTITRLQLVSVPPPVPVDRKEQPARARTPMPRTRTPAPARGSSTSPQGRPTRNNNRDSSRDSDRDSSRDSRDNSRDNNRKDKDTMTVSTKEWNSMKQQLSTMVKQHKELMQLLQGTLAKDSNQQ